MRSEQNKYDSALDHERNRSVVASSTSGAKAQIDQRARVVPEKAQPSPIVPVQSVKQVQGGRVKSERELKLEALEREEEERIRRANDD